LPSRFSGKGQLLQKNAEDIIFERKQIVVNIVKSVEIDENRDADPLRGI
jgi:hypothetical protein